MSVSEEFNLKHVSVPHDIIFMPSIQGIYVPLYQCLYSLKYTHKPQYRNGTNVSII